MAFLKTLVRTVLGSLFLGAKIEDQELTWRRPSRKTVHLRSRHTMVSPRNPPIQTRNPSTSCTGRSHHCRRKNGSRTTDSDVATAAPPRNTSARSKPGHAGGYTAHSSNASGKG